MSVEGGRKMCLAVPMKILSLEGSHALAEQDGVRQTINTLLTPEVEVGCYVLVHAGCSIQILDLRAAEETLNSVRELIAGKTAG